MYSFSISLSEGRRSRPAQSVAGCSRMCGGSGGGGHHVAGRVEGGPLDHRAQLAHVPGPGVALQRVRGLPREEVRGRRLALALAGEERLRQGQDVVAALAQRRHGQGHDAEAVEEVLPERARGHRLPHVHARGGHEAHVDLDRPRAPQALEAAVLHHAQELGLQVGGEVLHLVEEDGAAGGQLDLARLGLLGVGEGARLVAEQLRLQELGGDRRAVDLDEREVTPRAGVVQPVGERGPCRCRSRPG